MHRVKTALENKLIAEKVSSLPKAPNTSVKILADEKKGSQEEADEPKLSHLTVNYQMENRSGKQDVTNMPKSPNIGDKSQTNNSETDHIIVKEDEAKIPKSPNSREPSPTKNKIVKNDEVNRPKSPYLKVKTPTENQTVRHVGAKMPKSPNLRLKIPMDNQVVGQDEVRKQRSPNLRVKTPTENKTARQDGSKMPKSPNIRLKIPTDNKIVGHDEVMKQKSPNLRVKLPTENKNVNHDGVRRPRSPRSPVKMPMEMKSVAENVITNDSDIPENVKKEAEVDPDPWTFKKVCLTFAMGTSNHGFANCNRLWIAGYKKSSMVLLFISLTMPLLGFLVGFIGVRDIIQPNYFSTQITLISDTETGLALPKIIVSYSGLFNYSALQDFNVSRYEASLITTLLLGDVAHTITLDKNIEKANKDYHALLTRLNTTASEVWSLLSYKCHEVIIDCLFNGKRIPGPTCCKEHFEPAIVDTGLSYVSKTVFVQEREEIPSGLTLNLRVPIHPLDLDWEYMRGDAILLKSGLRVSVLDSNKDYGGGISSTTPVLGNDRILVSLSYDQHDNTGLYQSLFPWFDSRADCTSDHAPFRQLAAVGDNCMGSSHHVCGQKLRNCNLVSFPFWKANERFCDFKDQVAIVHSKAVAECRSNHVAHCGNLCQENVFRFSVQTCPLLEANETPDKGNNSNWSVDGAFTMFYTRLSHNLVKKSRTNFVDILCTLGGTMNNFMGASVLNLGEETTILAGIIIYTLVTIKRKIVAYRRRKAVLEE